MRDHSGQCTFQFLENIGSEREQSDWLSSYWPSELTYSCNKIGYFLTDFPVTSETACALLKK